MESNYEKQVFMARELFLKYDQDKMTAKFQLDSDSDFLYLRMLDSDYRIGRISGEIEKKGQNGYRACLDYQVVMSIYDVLCYSVERPQLAGEWRRLHNLQVTMSSPSTDTVTGKYAKEFSGRLEELKQVCAAVGGERPALSAGADVCWQFSVFPFFPVQFRFWDKDEEFDGVIQILWDKNSLDFMHFETLYYVLGHLLERLREGLMKNADGK